MERGVKDHPRTKKILAKFPQAQVVWIDHYKDVFCRRGQDYLRQHRAQSLIRRGETGDVDLSRSAGLSELRKLVFLLYLLRDELYL